MLHQELVQQRVPLLGLGGEAPEGLPQGGRQLVADKRKVKIGSELRRADEMETLEATFACMEAAENSGINEELDAMKKMCQKKKSNVKVDC